MSWWLLRQHKAFRPCVAAFVILVLGLVGVWFSSRPKQWSNEELSRLIPLQANGKFKVYSEKELKALNLNPADFAIPMELVKERSSDPRTENGLLDQYSVKTLYANGKLVEWNMQIRVEGHDPLLQKATYVRKGHLRIEDSEWSDFHEVQQCDPRSQLLSSGVRTFDLNCALTSTTQPLEKLNVHESYCSVIATSFRGRKTLTKNGKYTIKRVGTFSKAVREETSIDGDLICDGKREGYGQERTVAVYSVGDPSLIFPGAGNRKPLYTIKTVFDSAGRIVFQNRMELTQSVRPEPFYPERKQIVKNLKNFKSKSKKKSLARK